MKYWRKPLDLVSEDRVNLQKIIIEERCKGCGFCISFASGVSCSFLRVQTRRDTISPRSSIFPSVRIAHFCDVLCPEFAIYTAGGREKMG